MEGWRAVARLAPALLLMAAIFLTSLAGLTGCGGKAVVEPVRLTLGTYKGELNALIYVAQDQRYFQRNGLEVDIREFESGAAAVNELKAGNIDVAAAGEFVLMNNGFSRDDLRALACIAHGNVNMIVARKDRGIEEPADLKGRKIAVVPKTASDYFLRTFLISNDIASGQVDVVYMNTAELAEAVNKGTVDAGVIFNPNAYEIQTRLGDLAVTWSVQSGDEAYWLLISMQELVDREPEVVNRLLQSLSEAEDYLHRNPEDAMRIVGESIGSDPAYLEYAWEQSDFALHLDQELLLSMESEARWAIRNGYTDAKKAPNYLNLLYLGGMLEVKPEAVTVIH
jgi:ABC-type nitrate/sulfonate/bicarbonate transport system substrate-binding protein